MRAPRDAVIKSLGGASMTAGRGAAMRRVLAFALLLGLGLLGDCERLFRDMYEQTPYDPGEGSPLFADGELLGHLSLVRCVPRDPIQRS